MRAGSTARSGVLMARMETSDFVALIHLVGFVTGVALYGMLAVMAWRTSPLDAS